MVYPFYILNVILLLSNLRISNVYGVNIEAYKHSNFTGLLWKSTASASCNNIPESENGFPYSIRTDTCFIAYNGPDCKSRWSMKYLPGDITLLSTQLGRNGWIKSVHACNGEEGGSQLHVDLTNFYESNDLTPLKLKRYRNVCSCVNIPESVQNLPKWSMDNHHNDLLAYYEPDCSENKWSPKVIEAGHWTNSVNMHDHTKTDSVTGTTNMIMSFGPSPNSTYFQTSCDFHAVTTEISNINTNGTEMYENSTESGIELVVDGKDQFLNLTNKIVEIERQMDNFKQNEDKLTERIRFQEDFSQNLTQKIIKLENSHAKVESLVESQQEVILELVAKLNSLLRDKF